MNFLNTHIMLASLLTGWALDIIFGDPSRLPHPVVYMGKWISMGEHSDLKVLSLPFQAS